MSGAWLWSLLGAWRLDGLSALFAVLILAVGGAALVYSPAYLGQERYRGESRWRYWPLFALFLLGMLGAVAAWDLVLFLVCWEVMTLASYVLVAYEASDRQTLCAAFKYFVMTHVGTGCLLLGIVILGARAGSFSYDALPGAMRDLAVLRPGLLHLVLGLCFVAFATKGGLWPFGDWLPDAHPAAPAPVSAVLSGVMVKLGLYGFLRLFVWNLAAVAPGAAAGWGYGLLGFGVLSGLLGGMAATAALDAKVLLAYSSIAQSGLVAAGTGAALVLAPVHPGLAGLALLGAAFHVTGDAFVKSLLFLTAGSLQYRTGSRRLEDLGGLFQAMPVTGWAALLASLAIAGFPPLTAFVSKWLLMQSTIVSGTPFVAVAGLGVLLASLLSILYALKFFIAGFAGREMRAGDLEVPGAMRAAQLFLAGAVLALSAVPGLWLRALLAAFAGCPFLAASGLAGVWGAGALRPPSGAFAPLLLVLLGLGVAALARLALGTRAEPRRGAVWLGGLGGAAPRGQPLGFYSTVRPELERAYPRLRLPAWHRPAWVAGLPAAFDLDRLLYRPLAEAGRRTSRALRRTHTGLPHAYIAWQLAGALALVLFLILRRRGIAP